MMRVFIIFAIALMAVSAVHSQQPTSTPPPQPPPSSTPTSQTQVNPQPVRVRSADLRLMQQFPLNPVSQSDMLSARVVALQHMITPLYRKPTSKELAAIAPSAGSMQKYAEFLSQEGTGIVRLVPDSGCVNSDRVVSVKEHCLKYPFPGAGNSFSFRTESHRLRHLADITFVDGRLRITGIFMHSMITDIGDVEIEGVTATSPGMKFLTDFTPSKTSDDVIEIDAKFVNGVRDGRFVYAKVAAPKADTTYATRVIAYRGKIARSTGGIRYNELDYDRRRDVLVVFRIVEMDDERGVTIVWKKLADLESPRIKMPERELKGSN